ncbi:MAG: hypothetical protein K2N84_00415 [Clostridia bacterium]|nr:hypothetical protein [Clostridia bacterium]
MKFKQAISLLMAGFLAIGMSGCRKKETPRVSFSDIEYSISSGERVTAQTTTGGNIKYSIVGSVPAGVTLDENSGVVTFDESVAGGTQIMVRAESNGVSSLPIVVTLVQPDREPEITFTNYSEYLINGDAVTVVSKPSYAMTYALSQSVAGITVDRYTGIVNFADGVENNTKFSVEVTSSNGYKKSKEFIAKTAGFVRASEPVQLTEVGSRIPLSYQLDFTESPDAEFISLADGNGALEDGMYTYDTQTKVITLAVDYVNALPVGDSTISVRTTAHALKVTVKKADMLISDAYELAAIRSERANLSKYYIQTNDIDLTEYLANEPAGWYPIGVYHDVTNWSEASADAWAGIYDGNGHKITGGTMNRRDAEAYNSGLFGFTLDTSIIKNLGYEGGTHTVRSFSGTLVGVNSGLVENCYSTVGVRAMLNDPTAKARVIGGFVGRNNGTIKNCYAAGKVEADSDFGAFVGENNGRIENCYATAECNGNTEITKITFAGLGSQGDESDILFDTYDQMRAHKFNLGEGWVQEEGKLPTLVSSEKVSYVRRITVAKQAEYFNCGDEFDIEFTYSPSVISPEEKFTFEVRGEGVRVDEGGRVNTRNATCSEFTVIVSSLYASGERTYKLYDRPETVEIVNPDTEMLAGQKYKISSRVLPETANQNDVKYELVDAPKGVTLIGDVITVAEDVDDGTAVKYRAVFGKIVSDIVTAHVNGTAAFENNIIFFEGKISGDAQITFPHGTVTKISCSGKALQFTQSGTTVTIPQSELASFNQGSTMIILETAGKAYRASVIVADRIIRTVEDLINLGNEKNTKSIYYVLANDIDCNGAALKPIGEYTDDDNLDTAFCGIFDGAGHTISNFTVEGAFNAGFFGFLRGTVKDLHLEGTVKSPNNFVGGFVGSALDATITNCTFSGTVTAPNAAAVGAFVGKNSSSTITNCGVNCNLSNFFGMNDGTITDDYTF